MDCPNCQSDWAHVTETARSNGGITWSVIDRRAAVSGFAVAAPGHEEKHDYLTVDVVRNYVARHASALSGPGAHLGIWLDSDTWYLDVSRVYDDEDAAFVAASAADQRAVYDLSRGLTLVVPQYLKWDRPDPNDADPVPDPDPWLDLGGES